MAAQDKTVLAVATDDPLDVDIAIHRRDDVLHLAEWILDNAL